MSPKPHTGYKRRFETCQLSVWSRQVFITEAISDEEATLFMSHGNRGAHSTAGRRGRVQVRVPAMAVEKVFSSQYSAVKIDIEGAEYDLMKFLPRLSRCGLLCAELHFPTQHSRKQGTEFVNVLRSMGFRSLPRRSPSFQGRHWTTFGTWTRHVAAAE